MKYLIITCLCFFMLHSVAQNGNEKKPSIIDFHIFYTDFSTAQKIRTTSLSNVINNKLWSSLGNMQVGLGFSYLKGITKKIDAIATVDGSYIDYLFQSGATNGSSKFLLTTQVAANVKLFTDRRTIVPYITGGAGFSLYNGRTGFYIPAGMGIQFNIFNDGFVFTNAQYRFALSPNVNYHFNYSVGIGTNIAQQKVKTTKKEIPPVPAIDTVKEEVPEIAEVKIPAKTVVITVTDEATGQPLPYVAVTVSGPEGKKLTGSTDADGKVNFNDVSAADYTVSGILNNINTTTQQITTNTFSAEGTQINANITHNDPRFTLAGSVVNKTTNKAEGGVDVTVTNETQSSINTQQSKPGDGTFKSQLEANSDFTIVGKKASYLSNIEKVSTKGLNRSTTLYLKLELDMQEVTASKNIVLNNINFQTGKSDLNTTNSSDLNKLIQFLKDNPLLRLEIQGHTDNVGLLAKNNLLSQNRANAVVNYLVKNGIDKKRLTAKGYGFSIPIADNKTIEGKAQNRRVEMKLME